MKSDDDDSTHRTYCSTFAWHVLDRADPDRLMRVLVDELAVILGRRGRGDREGRRLALFCGIDMLGAAGLPIAITSRISRA